MTEGEIIEEIEKELRLAKNIDDVATTIRNEYIEGLLDLYSIEKEERQYEKELRLKYERRYNSRTEENKKLKEKNKELENADLTTVYMNGFYDGEKKWKDKIKQCIEKLEIEKKFYFEKQVIQGRIDLLQELLEERN